MSIRGTLLIVCGVSSLCSAWLPLAVNVIVHGPSAVSINQLIITALCAAALSIASMWVVYQFVQSVLRRLYDIEEAAALIASGRLHHRLNSMGANDEIARLAEQFNRMGDQIERQVGMLQQLADENRHLAFEAERVAAMDERQRLARELHDSVSQQLFSLTMLASAAGRQYASGSERLPQTLEQLNQLANAAQREMRALLLHLRPVELAGRSLGEAVASFVKAVEERHHLKCSLEMDVQSPLSSGVEESLFRILQEAMANVLKHAEATHVEIRLNSDAHGVSLHVLDNGVGIAMDTDTVIHSYGIRAMDERARAMGGRCNVWRRDQGTAVEVWIPLVHPEERPGNMARADNLKGTKLGQVEA